MQYKLQGDDHTEVTPVLIVGTGRCGSTMLSSMLREHPGILSLSEFFSFITDLYRIIPETFAEGPIGAAQFWEILGANYERPNFLLRHDIEVDEILYPYRAPNARFNAETGIPAILQVTLPHLTDDHDTLFDEVQQFALSRPPALMREHYQALFTWLQQRFKRQVWVERSGASLIIITQLIQNFPQARFVHIVRDGRNCALSMSRHSPFRMGVISFRLQAALGYNPFETDDRSGVENLPDELYRFLPEHFDAAAFSAYEVPPFMCGQYFWSDQLIQALPLLYQLPQNRLLTLRFEDFLTTPEESIRRLITFIHPQLADDAWIRRAASLVWPVRSSWQMLPAEEQALLGEACKPGFQALGDIYG